MAASALLNSVRPSKPAADSLAGAHLLDALEPCWPAGLALLWFYGLQRWLPSAGERRELQQYVCFGSVFIGSLWAMAQGRRLSGSSRKLWEGARLLLAAGALTTTLVWEVPDFSPSRDYLCAAVVGILAGFVFWSKRFRSKTPGHLLTCALFCLCARRLIPWRLTDTWPRQWLYAGPALACCALVAWALLRAPPSEPSRRKLVALHLSAAACLALGAARAWPADVSQHWVWLAGPAHMVREGGHLLWDTPSQYGFLNTLLVSWLPTHSVWYGLYIFNAFCNWVYALVVYTVYARLRPGAAMAIAALSVAGAAVFLMPGIARDLTGPQAYPSVGGYRFVWVALLVGIAGVADARTSHVRRDAQRKVLCLACGTLAWCMGCLWSAESMLWCSITWLPTACLLGMQYARAKRARMSTWRDDGRTWLWMLMGQAVAAAAMVGLAFVAYRLAYGHAPDAASFFDHARAYGGGFGAIPINPRGGVWGLVAIYVLAAASCVEVCRRLGLQALPGGALAATLALWSTSSYFVSRSDPSNALNVTPFVVMAAAAVFSLAPRVPASQPPQRHAMTWAALPTVWVILLLAYHQAPLLAAHATRWFDGTGVMQTGEVVADDPAMQQLLDKSDYRCGQPVMEALGNGVLPHMWCTEAATGERSKKPILRAWLPLLATSVLVMLPEDVRYRYVDRFITRQTYSDAWLFTSTPCDADLVPWHSRSVNEHYEKTTEALSDGRLCLHHYRARM